MSEFLDTNILVYAHSPEAAKKHNVSVDLIARLIGEDVGCISTQVLVEFYSIAIGKLKMAPLDAAAVVDDFGFWTIHRPSHDDIVEAARLHRRYKMQWWDALILRSAIGLGCTTLWSEDLQDGQRFGDLTVRNPFLR